MSADRIPRLRALQLGRAIRLVWSCAPLETVANLLLQLLGGLLPLVTLYLIKLLVDAVAAGLTAGGGGPGARRVLVLVSLAAGVALLGNLLRQLQEVATESQALRVTDHVFGRLHEKSAAVDLAFFENSRFYDTLYRAQQQAPDRPRRIVDGLSRSGLSATGLAAMAGLLLALHWGLALLLFVSTLPGVALRVAHSRRLYRWSRRRTPLQREAWYYHWVLTLDSFAKEVRLFGLGDLLRDRFRKLRKLLRGERLALTRRRTAHEALAQGLATAAVFAALGFVSLQALRGAITLGDLVMYYQAFQRGQGYLRELLNGLAGLYEDGLFLHDLNEFLDLPVEVGDPETPRPVPRPLRRGIEVRGVGFRYPAGRRPVLEGIDLALGPDEILALVGRNGAGKTTLVKLLCRLYDPTSGSIAWDGVDLRELRRADLRRQISVVFQDFARYQLTARENIGFGALEPAAAEAEVAAAARHAGLEAAIADLPDGYDTVLGTWFEGAVELSLGQWQKIALARAFLRDAQLVILDEPTGSLDAEAEEALIADFRRLVHGRAALLISHRLSTVRLAHRIVVLDGGRIVEEGDHRSLLGAGGLYARLFDAQAASFRRP